MLAAESQPSLLLETNCLCAHSIRAFREKTSLFPYFIKGICSCEVILYNFAFEVGKPLSSSTFKALGILNVSGKSELGTAC